MPSAKPIPIHAGPLDFTFHPGEAAISHLRFDGREVLRGISAPVRDVVWATVPPEISELCIEEADRHARIHFTASCRAASVDFTWRGQIHIDPVANHELRLRFSFDGVANAEFQANRIGFVVLHPAEAAGTPVTIEHPDGKIERDVFPGSIAPHQPFRDLRSLTHEYAPGHRAEVRMEGDTFETEDQRNWTDASFKTYCTPLAAPRPVTLRPGHRIRQEITLRLLLPITTATAAAPVPEIVRPPADSPGPLPPLGTQWRSAAPPSPAVIAALRPLRLAHLRLDLWLARADAGESLLRAGAKAAAQLGAALELALHVHGNRSAIRGPFAHLRDILATLRPQPRIARWLIFDTRTPFTPAEALRACRETFSATPFAAPIGGGATDNFTELNRGLSEPATAAAFLAAADFTVHACNPQVHATDDTSILETIPLQALTIREARRLSGNLPAILSPLTLTRRWRAGEAGCPSDLPPDLPAALLPFRPDPRHATPFAAAWATDSLAAQAAAGASSITAFEATGDNGLVSPDGQPHPLYAVFARYGG